MSKKTRNLTNKAGELMKCDGQMLKKVIEAKGYKCNELSKMLRYCSDYLTTCCRTNKISDVAAKYLMDYKIFPQMYDLEGVIKVDEPKEVKIDKDEKKYIESDKKAADELRKKLDRINKNSTYGCSPVEFYTEYGVIRSEKDLRHYIKQAINPYSSLNIASIYHHSAMTEWGYRLIQVRDFLEEARNSGLTYNLEDMRNDLLVYATKVKNHPDNWIRFVEHLNLVNEGRPFTPTAQEIKKVLNEKYGNPKKDVECIDYGYGPAPKNPSYYAAGHDIAKGVFKLMQATMNDLKRDPEFKELIKQAVKEAYEEL